LAVTKISNVINPLPVIYPVAARVIYAALAPRKVKFAVPLDREEIRHEAAFWYELNFGLEK
jgi:hypothetical protein